MNELALLGLLAVVSVGLILYALWPKGKVDKEALKRRMMGKRGVDETIEIQKQAKESTAQKMLERVAPIAMRPVMPKSDTEVSMLRIKLANAGFRRENASTLFLSSKTVCGIGCALVALVFQLSAGKPAMDVLTWVIGSGGVGFMLPNVWLWIARGQRATKIKHGLADAMDLLVISVESGLALDAAIQRVGDEMKIVHPELSEEMQLVTYEGQMGIPRSEALSNMAMRTGVPEMQSLVAIITQAEKFGTSVAKALRNQADAMRVKRRQAAEEKAQATTVKLMLPLMLFIFPAIFVVLVGPAALNMIKTFQNNPM
ncbi:MAG: type II secretion system F family protein [Planctomycetes bacterium]|nr:type II secretion system F family protein [Planctomycetota bacterium]